MTSPDPYIQHTASCPCGASITAIGPPAPNLIAMFKAKHRGHGESGKIIDCCHTECDQPAEFEIFGQHGFEDYTFACEAHVGWLLGTPMWASGPENTKWTVYLIKSSSVKVTTDA